ncbi:MAG: NAD(P)-dependent oxidoreductase, partial [Alphaproteobacteria bacterium]
VTPRPIIVVEDDPFLRLIQVILDPLTPQERLAAFAHFMAHDEPDFIGWCERLRADLGGLYPAEVRLFDSEEDFLARLPGAQIAVVESTGISAQAIAAAAGALRIVQKYGTVTAGIDHAACAAAGIRVLTLRRRANIATAEHGLALMLALARQINQNCNLISVEQLRAAGFTPTTFDRAHTPNGNWARIKGLRTLYGQQLGIVGLGEIGRELALRAAALGMRIVYNQRHRLAREVEASYQATYSLLDDLLASSDCVSLHLPRAAETRGFIGRRELALIKAGALLINVSQPDLVDREALREALASGQLGGYGLDIFYEEPAEAKDPLTQFRNVIITPHLGGSPRTNALNDFEEMLMGMARTLRTP